MVKNVNIGNRLDHGERHGKHTGPLINLATTGFTIFGKFFEARDGLAEELEDDGGGDVWRKSDQDNGEGG